jgi:hypothetical protein
VHKISMYLRIQLLFIFVVGALNRTLGCLNHCLLAVYHILDTVSLLLIHKLGLLECCPFYTSFLALCGSSKIKHFYPRHNGKFYYLLVWFSI